MTDRFPKMLFIKTNHELFFSKSHTTEALGNFGSYSQLRHFFLKLIT